MPQLPKPLPESPTALNLLIALGDLGLLSAAITGEINARRYTIHLDAPDTERLTQILKMHS